MTLRQKLAIIFLLSLLGLADAAWLTSQSLVSTRGMICGPVGDCERVLSSAYARQLGLPVSTYGLLLYAALLLLAHLSASVRDPRKPLLFLRGVASLGVLGSAGLMYIQFFVLHAFCLLCTLSAVLTVSIWLLSLFSVRETIGREDPLTPVTPGGRRLLIALSVFVLLLYSGFALVVAGSNNASPGIVARFGEDVITEAELNEGMLAFLDEHQRELHEAKMQWLEKTLAVRLLRKEAERRGVSVMSVEDEAVGLIPPLTDAEFAALARTWKVDVKALTETDKQYVRSLVTAEKRDARLKRFVDSLKKTFNVAVFLPAPLPRHAQFDFTGSPRAGRDDAPVTVVVFMDFECLPCVEVARHLHGLRESFADSVRLVIKHCPMETHPDAFLAAEAALCANEQGRFWSYHDLLFANQGRLGKDMLIAYAAEAGIDLTRFKQSLESRKFRHLVERDRNEAQSIGVSGTPTVFVNGVPVSGDLSLERLRMGITAALHGTLNTAGAGPSGPM